MSSNFWAVQVALHEQVELKPIMFLSACVHDMLCLVVTGHDRLGTTVWLALALWCTMALGEAALLEQSSMCLAAWAAIFGLPSLYLRCRHILDALVEEALRILAAYVKAGPQLMRPATLLACAVIVITMQHAPCAGLFQCTYAHLLATI